MPWKVGTPGCCACTCVADGVTNVCVCSCLDPYLKTATLGDDNGTHTLTGGTPSLGWNSPTYTISSVVTYSANGSLVCQVAAGTTLPYHYVLTYNCGLVKWRLGIVFPAEFCKVTSGGPLIMRYATGTDIGSPIIFTDIALDCSNTSMLTFVLPTTLTGGQPTPGGGGTLSVVF